MSLMGKLALVTGGGGGIGAGIAAALIEQGARVVIADLDERHLAEATAQLGGQATTYQIDVTDRASWAAAQTQIEAELGPLDILCNNAGIATPRGLIDEMDPALFDRVVAVNITGVFNGVQCFAPGMRARGRGHIVNTASVNGLLPFGSFTAYSASKCAVAGLSEALREELAPYGVGVSILYPGLTRSRMSLSPDVGASGGRPMTPQIEAMMMDPLWLGRATAQAIVDNAAHIITHPAYLPQVEARFAAITGSFGAPAQPGYGEAGG
jgi:NAD(P)-dependent dehydrogenase (short-subunit alcohol dehydrogenase family)